MTFTEKGQEVMLTERIELNIFDDDHLIVIGFEYRAIDDFIDIVLIPLRQVLKGLRGALRSFLKTLSGNVFPDVFYESLKIFIHGIIRLVFWDSSWL